MHYFISYLLIYPDGPESGHLVLPYRGHAEIKADIEAIQNDNVRFVDGREEPAIPAIQILCMTFCPQSP